MRSWGLGAFAAGLVAIAVVAVIPFFRADRDFPAAITSPPPLVAVTLDVVRPGEALCMGGLAAEPHSQVARLKVGTYGKTGPPLELTVTGADYRTTASVAGGYPDNGVTSFRIRPPRRALLVRACVRNKGRVKIALYSAADRARSRAQVAERGRALVGTPEFGFWEAKPRSIAARLPAIVDRMAAFRGPLGYAWVVWLVLGLAALALTAGVAAVLWAAHSRRS